MKVKNQNENNSMSLGQERRLEKKREIEKAKRNARLRRVIFYSAIVLISVGFFITIGYSIYHIATKIKPSSDYSAYLTDDGLIKDVSVNDLVNLVDYKNITVPLSEIEYSNESIDSDIKTLLEDYGKLATDTDALVEDGNHR
ncbi:MAG: hypothetical protein WCD89_26855 [Anaerocolumna sp.]